MGVLALMLLLCLVSSALVVTGACGREKLCRSEKEIREVIAQSFSTYRMYDNIIKHDSFRMGPKKYQTSKKKKKK